LGDKWVISSAQRRAIQVLGFVVIALAALAALSVLSALGWMSS
jgi:hypothetical protein